MMCSSTAARMGGTITTMSHHLTSHTPLPPPPPLPPHSPLQQGMPEVVVAYSSQGGTINTMSLSLPPPLLMLQGMHDDVVGSAAGLQDQMGRDKAEAEAKLAEAAAKLAELQKLLDKANDRYPPADRMLERRRGAGVWGKCEGLPYASTGVWEKCESLPCASSHAMRSSSPPSTTQTTSHVCALSH